MTKFVCKNCNYRFESEIPREKNKCPYCGRNEVGEDPSAEDLVNEE